MEKGQSFQGVVLKGTLEGKATRGRLPTGSLKSEIETAVNLCIKGLSERFDILLQTTECQPSTKSPTTVYGPKEVVKDMLIFNVDVWPTRSSDLMDYGRAEIQRLTDWFKVALERSGCNVQNIHDQWVSLKISVNSQFRKMEYAGLWETLLSKLPYKEDFADVLHLVEILLVLPISAAQCERAVSAQNRIKSSTRATLNVAVLEDLIRLSSEGPPVADFEPARGERSRRPHFSVKKP